MKGLGRIPHAGEFASDVYRALRVCAVLMVMSLFLLLPSTTHASEKRNFVAVIVDDSRSMSFAQGRVGSDPAGLAAFAASQLSRFVPDGTTLGVFTFQSANGELAGPLHVAREITAETRTESYQALSRLLKEQNKAKALHPYAYGGTPCNSALEAAANWLKRKTGDGPEFTRTVLLLTDGKCTQNFNKATVTRHLKRNAGLAPTALHCVGFGKEARKVEKQFEHCDGSDLVAGPGEGMDQASRSKGLLAVLEAFSKRLDASRGRTTTRLVRNNAELQKMPPRFDQAVGVDLIVAQLCDDPATCESLNPLAIPDNPNTAALLKRVKIETWKWPDSDNNKAKNPSEDIPRFRTAYVRLSPEEYRIVRGGESAAGLDLSDKNRTAIFRSEYDLQVDIRVYPGQCPAKDVPTIDRKPANNAVGNKWGCFEARILTGSDWEKDLASYETLSLVYGGEADKRKRATDLPQMNMRIWKTFTKEVAGKLEPIAEHTDWSSNEANYEHGRGNPTHPHGPAWRWDEELPACNELTPTGEAGVDQKLRFEFNVKARADLTTKWEESPTVLAAKTFNCFAAGDLDGDGYGPSKDCNNNPQNGGASDYPGARELCDGRDNDCDGETDEDLEHLMENGKCLKDCYWDLSDASFQEIADDLRVVHFGEETGTPGERRMTRRSVDRKLTTVNKTRLAPPCAIDRGTASAHLDLKMVDGQDASALQDPCFKLSGHEEGFTLTDQADENKFLLTLKRDPLLCGVLGAEPVQTYERDVKLVVNLEKSKGLVADKAKEFVLAKNERKFTLRAQFDQSLEVTPLQSELDLYDPDSVLRLSIKPNLGLPGDDGATSIKIKRSDLDLGSIKRHLNAEAQGFVRSGDGASGPEWVKCDPERSLLPDEIAFKAGECQSDADCGGPSGVTRCAKREGSESGICAVEVCIRMVNPEPCPGGTLFSLGCNCIKDSDDLFCNRVPARSSSGQPLTAGLSCLAVEVGGENRTYSSCADKPDFKLSPSTMAKVTVRAERSIGDWFWPESGPGWWWLVITAQIIWLRGVFHTHTHTFASAKSPPHVLPILLSFITLWAVTLTIWLALTP